MSKQLQDAYIVAATRTPIGKSHRGFFRNTRPDDLLAHALRAALAAAPGLDPAAIEDIICGCAIPEAQQGLNVARIGAVLAGLPTSVGGITVNRFCASGLSAVAMAADRIRVGEAEVMIAAGVESMSMVPMMGNSPSLSPSIFAPDSDVGIAYGMGLTAEKVAQQWKVSREAQDAFAVESHRRAIAAQSLAVMNTLGLDASKVNPMGGAIALGHPLGATGAIRSATVVHALKRNKLKYGMVTMCVGMGQGAAGIFESV